MTLSPCQIYPDRSNCTHFLHLKLCYILKTSSCRQHQLDELTSIKDVVINTMWNFLFFLILFSCSQTKHLYFIQFSQNCISITPLAKHFITTECDTGIHILYVQIVSVTKSDEIFSENIKYYLLVNGESYKSLH